MIVPVIASANYTLPYDKRQKSNPWLLNFFSGGRNGLCRAETAAVCLAGDRFIGLDIN